MRAIKANKEYAISESEKKRYIEDGYDIVDFFKRNGDA